MKSVIKRMLNGSYLVTFILFMGCVHQDQVTMKKTSDMELFPKGNKLSNEWFTGDAFLTPLLARDKNNEFAMGSVHFEPNARTNWHRHPKGQVLIITDGEGFYQEEGKPARRIRKGDIVNIPEGIVHWHGATAESSMVHIAVTNYLGEENVTWLSAVSEQDYQSVNTP